MYFNCKCSLTVSASADNLPMKTAIYIPLDNAQACGHAEKKEVVADDKSHVISSGMQKNIAKKQRNECDKGNLLFLLIWRHSVLFV